MESTHNSDKYYTNVRHPFNLSLLMFIKMSCPLNTMILFCVSEFYNKKGTLNVVPIYIYVFIKTTQRVQLGGHKKSTVSVLRSLKEYCNQTMCFAHFYHPRMRIGNNFIRVCLSVCLCICLSVCLSICLSVCLCVCLFRL